MLPLYSIKLTRNKPTDTPIWQGSCVRFKGMHPVAIFNTDGDMPSEVLKKIETWIATAGKDIAP